MTDPSFETVELIENLIDAGGRDAEVAVLRGADAAADGDEHGEFTFEVCCGSVAHCFILP
ncbi:hypothetical protein [Rhodococcus wratislaviensis]|nr:hypothetical protein [Rhodococcus wratislaviensis]